MFELKRKIFFFFFFFFFCSGCVCLFVQGHVVYQSCCWEGLRGKSMCKVRLLAACWINCRLWLSHLLDVSSFCHLDPFLRAASNQLFFLSIWVPQINFFKSSVALFLIGPKIFLYLFIFLIHIYPRSGGMELVEFQFDFTYMGYGS